MPNLSLRPILNYSPNFDLKKRKSKQIKFIIFHYTGMQKEKDAIMRLTNFKSKVSCHYFIKNNGDIINLVPDSYIAWHAGVSVWQSYKFLNKNSIGIEINNPGHSFKYKNFSKKQILSILKLCKYLIEKYKIKSKFILGHSDISPNRKKDPGEKFPWKYLAKKNIGFWHSLNQYNLLKNRNILIKNSEKKKFFSNIFKIGYSNEFNIVKNKYSKKFVEAFQRRFRPQLINGIIDKECLIISKNLLKIIK